MSDQQGPQPAWLDDLPVLALALDEAGNIAWLSRSLCQRLGLDAGALMGQPAAQQAAPLPQLLAGDDELIHLTPAVGSNIWLHCQVRRSQGADGAPVTLLHFADITAQMLLEQESQRLQQEVDTLRLTDAVTGLPNQRALGQALERQVSLSRRYQNPLSIAVFQVEAAVAEDSERFRELAHYLRDRLRWVDQIGKWGESGFVAILPETGAEDAQRLASAIVDEHTEQGALGLKQGVAGWQKGDGARQLLGRAAEALAEADAVASE